MGEKKQQPPLQIDDLITKTINGDGKALRKLLKASDESREAASKTADLFLEGKGDVPKDTTVAFALYYKAAVNGDERSRKILSDHSASDVDASYYYELSTSDDEILPLDELIDKKTIDDIVKKWDDSKDSKAALLMKERDELNNQVKEWIAKRNELNAEVRRLVNEAGKHKKLRDELHLKVREAKAIREEANQRVASLTEEYQAMRWNQTVPNRDQPSLKQLKMEFKELEMKQATQVLKRKEEEALVRRLIALDYQITEIERSSEKPADTYAELRAAKEEAEKCHKLVSEFAEKAQVEHEAMIRLYEEADSVRKEANEAQAKYVECKELADKTHKEYIELIKGHSK